MKYLEPVKKRFLDSFDFFVSANYDNKTEIFSGHLNVFSGYVDNLVAASNRLIMICNHILASEFARKSSARMYRTDGEGGLFRYRGRQDLRAEVNKHRIGLKDTEVNIRRLPRMMPAFVVFTLGNGRLIHLQAYAAFSPYRRFSDSKTEQLIKVQIKCVLSEYMFSRKTVYRANLLSVSNGKAERQSLAAAV